MFDFSKLLDSNFLFNPTPAQLASKNIWLLIFSVIIILAIIVWVVAHFLIKKSKLLRKFIETKVFYLLLALGLVGLVLTACRIAGAAYLSMRFIFILFLFLILAWAIYLAFYLVLNFPKEYQEEIDNRRREKYLPRKGKSKK